MKTILDDIVDKMPDQFNMMDIMARIEERTPYIVVAFQVILFRDLFQFYFFISLHRSVRG